MFDNSHIMGTNAVGAMIVAGPAGLMKQHYRTFNIKSEELAPGDDYGMMREVLRRRFSRLVEGGAARENPLPLSRQRRRIHKRWPSGSVPSPLRGGAGVGGDGPDRDLSGPALRLMQPAIDRQLDARDPQP